MSRFEKTQKVELMTIEEFNNLSINEIVSRFQEWKRLIENGASVDDMKQKIFSLINGCPFETILVEKGKFYRARKNNGDKLFEQVSDFNYPPSSLINKMGRANRINESMMYLGQDGRTALFEMRLKKNDFVSVSEWEIRFGKKLNLMYLSSIENLQIPSLSEFIRTKNHRFSKYKYTKQGVENVNFIHRLLSEEFLRTDDENPEKAYTLSTAITETLLSYENSDGLIYPSLKSKNDVNIVLKPKCVDKALKMNKCDFFEIINELEDKIEFRHINVTSKIDYKSGKLEWTDDLPGNLNWHSSGTPSLQKLI